MSTSLLGKARRFALEKTKRDSSSSYSYMEMKSPIIRNRANLLDSSRKIKYIAPEEIYLAVKKVVEESIAISLDDTVTLISNMFGFSRVTEDMRIGLLAVLNEAVQKNIVDLDGELLKA